MRSTKISIQQVVIVGPRKIFMHGFHCAAELTADRPALERQFLKSSDRRLANYFSTQECLERLRLAMRLL